MPQHDAAHASTQQHAAAVAQAASQSLTDDGDGVIVAGMPGVVGQPTSSSTGGGGGNSMGVVIVLIVLMGVGARYAMQHRAKANDAVRRLNAQALQEAAEENLEY